MPTPGTAARETKGTIQYRRLTPLGGTGLSALGLGLSSPAAAAPPKRDRCETLPRAREERVPFRRGNRFPRDARVFPKGAIHHSLTSLTLTRPHLPVAANRAHDAQRAFVRRRRRERRRWVRGGL